MKFNPLDNVTIKTKVIITMVLVFLFGFWLEVFITTSRIEHDIIKLLSDQHYSAVSYIAADMEDKLKLRVDALQEAAAKITPEIIASSGKARNYIKNRPGLPSLFQGGVALVSKKGIGIADYPSFPGRQGGSFKELTYVQDVLTTGKIAFAKPRVGLYTKRPGVAIGVPVEDKSGSTVAVLEGFSTFADTTLFGRLEQSTFGKSGYILIVTPKYRLIATSSDSARILTPIHELGSSEMIDKIAAGYEGSDVFVNQDGVKILASFKRISPSNWLVVSVLPADEAFAPIENLQRIRYGSAAVVSILSIIFGWWLLRRQLRPLEEATNAIESMVSGKTKPHELPVLRKDEIGRLLSNFNLLMFQRNEIQNKLEKLAQTDPLTNLANRRHFMELAERELTRTIRYGRSLSLLMMDIDQFKHINDNYGHKAGDVVLQKFGQFSFSVLRDVDVVGRLGGDEFAVLLPETDCEQAFDVANRLNGMFFNASVSLEQGELLHSSVSIGVATLTDKSSDVETLLSQADAALYEAKRSGRNRVCVFHSE